MLWRCFAGLDDKLRSGPWVALYFAALKTRDRQADCVIEGTGLNRYRVLNSVLVGIRNARDLHDPRISNSPFVRHYCLK
jgi:hypothetical protein